MYRSTSDYSLAPPSHSLIASPVHVIIPPHQHSNSNFHYRNRHLTIMTITFHERQFRENKSDGSTDSLHKYNLSSPVILHRDCYPRLHRKQRPAILLSPSSPFMFPLALIKRASSHQETFWTLAYAFRVALIHLEQPRSA